MKIIKYHFDIIKQKELYIKKTMNRKKQVIKEIALVIYLFGVVAIFITLLAMHKKSSYIIDGHKSLPAEMIPAQN